MNNAINSNNVIGFIEDLTTLTNKKRLKWDLSTQFDLPSSSKCDYIMNCYTTFGKNKLILSKGEKIMFRVIFESKPDIAYPLSLVCDTEIEDKLNDLFEQILIADGFKKDFTELFHKVYLSTD